MDINITVLGEMITFLVFVLFTMKYVWPPITKAMRDRAEHIAQSLASAEESRRLKERMAIEMEEEMAQGHRNRLELYEKAKARVDMMLDDAKLRAREEGDALIERARADIDGEVARAREALKAEVAGMVVSAVSRILSKEADQAAHDRVVKALLEEV